MPAIKPERRHFFDHSAQDLGNSANCAGDLQYLLSVIFETYIENQGLRYQQLNDIMGALSGAEKEFFEHVVSPYEAIARYKNGMYYTKTKNMLDKARDELTDKKVSGSVIKKKSDYYFKDTAYF